MNNKQLKQESISLTQDAQQTWVKLLPRTELKSRFVIIERTSRDSSKRHIVANVDTVRAWLKFLFKNHKTFIQMKEDGDLDVSEEALSVLENEPELAEVFEDVESEEEQEEDGIPQPELQSGFSKTDVFTLDKYPYLYLKARDFLKIKQDGKMEITEDTSVRRPIYTASATTLFPYLFCRGERSPLDYGDYKLSRYLLKKLVLFAFKMGDSKYSWKFAEDAASICPFCQINGNENSRECRLLPHGTSRFSTSTNGKGSGRLQRWFQLRWSTGLPSARTQHNYDPAAEQP
jgi:hypothetical protein